MNRDKKETEKVKHIWEENSEKALDLGYCYFDSSWDNIVDIEKKDKRDAASIMFSEGIRAALDIVLPLLGDKDREMVDEKIRVMTTNRRQIKDSVVAG